MGVFFVGLVDNLVGWLVICYMIIDGYVENCVFDCDEVECEDMFVWVMFVW